ncbi:aminoglycoside phosphotransferase family protein [Halomonas sp. QHL1]|uniref:aminoglycoside phosphotransferase family protein n=1 Tax=Halomonas sp. QHL1 TaxID=1123773 RepID=UPI0008FD9447|nr:phosphotransferase [Halomonas sp. QHL1]OJA05358.1 aminoglycoside phosphotransferase [Halomonas sp. QHL1]
MSSYRINALTTWAAQQNGLIKADISLSSAVGDASFRRYFRLTLPDGTTQVVMDAPPEREDSQPFVAIAKRWRSAGLPVPKVHATNLAEGFLLLEDLGNTPLQRLFSDDATTQAYHAQALTLIAELQNRANPDSLPAYDTALLGRELDLFPEWCLSAWLTLPPPDSWPAIRVQLIQHALAQPVVTVHRDFDAMNLMMHDQRLFMIDFQDAVAGPLSYDVISLLRGRYCRFSSEQFANFVEAFYHQARRDGRLPSSVDFATFLSQCHAMAAQRSLKVLGIFCRLTLRDQKSGYLERLLHFLDHLEDSLSALTFSNVPEQVAFAEWVKLTLRPAIMKRLTEMPS